MTDHVDASIHDRLQRLLAPADEIRRSLTDARQAGRTPTAEEDAAIADLSGAADGIIRDWKGALWKGGGTAGPEGESARDALAALDARVVVIRMFRRGAWPEHAREPEDNE